MFNRPYTCFVMLGSHRTGSTMLQTTLDKHPEIHAYGEIFNNNAAHRENESRRIRSAIHERDNPSRYLQKVLYTPDYPPEIHAVGFKLFYNHRALLGRRGWNRLRMWKLHILHLQRHNLLNQFLSYKLALRKWEATPENRVAYDHPIRVDPEEFLRYILSISTERREKAKFLKHNPTLNLFYEDFTSDTAFHLQSILEFLCVSPTDLEIRTRKAKEKPNSEILINYDELKEFFFRNIKTGVISEENAWWFDDEVSLS